MKKRFFMIGILAVSGIWIHASTVVFEKPLGDAKEALLRCESKMGQPPESTCRYNLVVRDQGSRERLIWSRDLPAYASNNVAKAGFRFLDIMPAGDGWFLCYKVQKITFVERSNPAAGVAAAQPTEIEADRDGFGPPVTQAAFSETNNLPLLRLGYRGYKTRAWTYSENSWSSTPQYEVKIPAWAWPIDMSSSSATNDLYRESFPAGDFSEAKWGSSNQGLQLGLSLEKTVYHAGEQVFARVHVRNVSNEPRRYAMTTVASKDGPIDFVIKDARGELLTSENSGLALFVPPSTKQLPIDTQNVRGFSLDKQYALRPGSYAIRAQLKATAANGSSVVLASDVATIQIVLP